MITVLKNLLCRNDSPDTIESIVTDYISNIRVSEHYCLDTRHDPEIISRRYNIPVEIINPIYMDVLDLSISACEDIPPSKKRWGKRLAKI